MDDAKAMTRAGETVGKAVSSGLLAARRGAQRAGQAGVEVTSKAAQTADRKLTERGVAPRQLAEALAEGAEVARQEVAKTTRRARRKLAKTAKSTRKDLAKAAKQARKDAAKSKTAKQAHKTAKQARSDAAKLKASFKADATALKKRARAQVAVLNTESPKRKRRWPKVLLLAIVAGGVAFVVRSKAAQRQEDVPPTPRPAEPAAETKAEPKPEAPTSDASQNGQPQKSSTKS
jgi:hypothetical protein